MLQKKKKSPISNHYVTAAVWILWCEQRLGTAPLLHQNTIPQIFWNILSRKETFDISRTAPLLHQNNQNAIPEMFLKCSVLDLFDLAKTQGYQGQLL